MASLPPSTIAIEAHKWLISQGCLFKDLPPNKLQALAFSLFGWIHKEALFRDFPSLEPIRTRFNAIKTHLKKELPYEDLAETILHIGPYSSIQPHLLAAQAILDMLLLGSFPKMRARRLKCAKVPLIYNRVLQAEAQVQEVVRLLFNLASSQSLELFLPIKNWISMESDLYKTFAIYNRGKRISYLEAFNLWGDSLGEGPSRLTSKMRNYSLLTPFLNNKLPTRGPEILLTNTGLTIETESSFQSWLAEMSVIALLQNMDIDPCYAPFFGELKILFLKNEEGRRTLLYVIYKKIYDENLFLGQSKKILNLAKLIVQFKMDQDNPEALLEFSFYIHSDNKPMKPKTYDWEKVVCELSDNGLNQVERGKMCALLNLFADPSDFIFLLKKLPRRSYSVNLTLLENLLTQRSLITFLLKLGESEPMLMDPEFVDSFSTFNLPVTHALYPEYEFFEALYHLKSTKGSTLSDYLNHVHTLLSLPKSETINYLKQILPPDRYQRIRRDRSGSHDSSSRDSDSGDSSPHDSRSHDSDSHLSRRSSHPPPMD